MHEFLEACGLDRRLRLDLDGPGGPERRSLDQPFAVIGRNAGADLTLSDRRVSRRHAYLQAIAGEVFCVDLGSRSGVCWGRRLGRSGWIDREQGVVINPFRIRQAKAGRTTGGSGGSDRPHDPLAKQSEDLGHLGSVVLEFSHEAAEPSSWRMNRLLTLVGRSPQCQVRLIAPGISPFHCSLVSTPTGVWAVDLLGRGGIVVNGASVRSRQIDDGDEMRIGSVSIRFRCESPRIGTASTVGIVSENREMHPVAAIDRARRPREMAVPPATGWKPARDVARRVVASSTEIGDPANPDHVHLANQSRPGPWQVPQPVPMLDHFQLVMKMIGERFRDDQRDQMQVVREEITQIHQLNGELQALHSRLSATPHTAPLPCPQSPPRTLPPIDSTSAGPPAVDLSPSAESPALFPTTESGLSAPGLAPSQRAESSPLLRARGPIEVGVAAVAPEVMHGLICRRMEALEGERKGHWQRILDLVSDPQTGPSGV